MSWNVTILPIHKYYIVYVPLAHKSNSKISVYIENNCISNTLSCLLCYLFSLLKTNTNFNLIPEIPLKIPI